VVNEGNRASTGLGVVVSQKAWWPVACPVQVKVRSGRSLGQSPRVMRNLCSLSAIRRFHKNLGHVSAPLFKRNPALVKKFVALIDSGNARDCT
jgi:hypothetical protein